MSFTDFIGGGTDPTAGGSKAQSGGTGPDFSNMMGDPMAYGGSYGNPLDQSEAAMQPGAGAGGSTAGIDQTTGGSVSPGAGSLSGGQQSPIQRLISSMNPISQAHAEAPTQPGQAPAAASWIQQQPADVNRALKGNPASPIQATPGGGYDTGTGPASGPATHYPNTTAAPEQFGPAQPFGVERPDNLPFGPEQPPPDTSATSGIWPTIEYRGDSAAESASGPAIMDTPISRVNNAITDFFNNRAAQAQNSGTPFVDAIENWLTGGGSPAEAKPDPNFTPPTAEDQPSPRPFDVASSTQPGQSLAGTPRPPQKEQPLEPPVDPRSPTAQPLQPGTYPSEWNRRLDPNAPPEPQRGAGAGPGGAGGPYGGQSPAGGGGPGSGFGSAGQFNPIKMLMDFLMGGPQALMQDLLSLAQQGGGMPGMGGGMGGMAGQQFDPMHSNAGYDYTGFGNEGATGEDARGVGSQDDPYRDRPMAPGWAVDPRTGKYFQPSGSSGTGVTNAPKGPQSSPGSGEKGTTAAKDQSRATQEGRREANAAGAIQTAFPQQNASAGSAGPAMAFTGQDKTAPTPTSMLPPFNRMGRARPDYRRGPVPSAASMSTFRAPNGHAIHVSAEAMPYFQGFLNDMAAAGAPIKTVYGYALKNIQGTRKISQHSYGNAIDVNQVERNRVLPEYANWVNRNRGIYNQLLLKYGLYDGARFGDFGHLEYGGGGGEISQAQSSTEAA